MSNKSIGSKTLKAGAALLAVGAGVAALNAKNKNGTEKKKIKEIQKTEHEEYRNTERGKYDKNSKGIYYSNGNYEAFARPEKPDGVDDKSAYIVGSGLASLAAACFLVSASGICSEVFLHLKSRELQYLMNITGLTSMTLTTHFAGQLLTVDRMHIQMASLT